MEPIEICWFYYQGNCVHGRFCKWTHVSKGEIDLKATYVFCSGVDHRRTVEQTRKIIQENNSGRSTYVAAPPTPPGSPRSNSAPPSIRAIRFKVVEHRDGGVVITTYESQSTMDEIRKTYGENIYDAEFTFSESIKRDFVVSRDELVKRTQPRTSWGDM